MAVRKFKPVTPGTRHKIAGTFEEVTKSAPEKSLLEPKKSTGGRNSNGKMTVRYRGGGHKQMYRIIDFKRTNDGMPATVKAIEYDPNRSARIALIVYANGEKSYILAPNGLKVGQTIVSGSGVAPEVGNTLPLAEIPLGTVIHAIELYPGQGAAMARSAGTYAQLLAREGKYAIIKLPSAETRMVLTTCRATRPPPLAGPQAAQPRCHHEPGRPPHGWWRGPFLGWAPAFAQRFARQRLQDPQPEKDYLEVHYFKEKVGPHERLA